MTNQRRRHYRRATSGPNIAPFGPGPLLDTRATSARKAACMSPPLAPTASVLICSLMDE